MYWITGIIVILYMALFLVSRRERKGKSPPGIMGVFHTMAVFLYNSACRMNLPIVSSVQVGKDLKSLHPEMDGKQLLEDYYVKKISLSLLVCLVGALFGAAVTYSVESGRLLAEGAVVRGNYTEAAKEMEVSATLPSGKEKQFQVTVYPQKLTQEEAETLYVEFVQKLPELFLGDNISVEQLTKDLLLDGEFAGYPFYVEWRSNRPGVLSSSGTVYSVEEPVEIVLTADISYEEYKWQENFEVTVVPPILSEPESMERDVEELLQSSERDSRAAEEWTLPESYRGQDLIWKEVVQNYGPIFLIGAAVIAVLIFLMADKDLHDELTRNREGMKRAYPDVVQKLLLYLGAGMTVRASFQKMASEYEEECQKKGNTQSTYSKSIYREICYMCRELQAGVSESAAYEHFGKRVGIQEYLRLSTLLSQNLKKGNSTLLQRLREEAGKANAERLQNSRKLGEEASTKLLLPMVLLLVVVMLIIMLPAFSSMGM